VVSLLPLRREEDDPGELIADLKHDSRFHKFILEAIKQKVTGLKSKEPLKERSPKFLDVIQHLARSSL
jgi:hypothetical protein